MMPLRILAVTALTGILFLSCEDIVDVPSDFDTPRLVVEAWLTDEPGPQVIDLTLSQDFFTGGTPPRVEGALVAVCRDTSGSGCIFFGEESPGRYVWTPTADRDRVGQAGETFYLGVQLADGEQFFSSSTMQRVPPIDSISFYFEEAFVGIEEGFFAEFYARDPVGRGDAYLIRSYYNDTLLVRPFELSLAYDATFEPGADADGNTFIAPIRSSINPQDEDGLPLPMRAGDSIAVELWSLTDEAFFFLSIAGEQVQNGGIFAIPLANAPGNVFSVADEQPVLGFFHVASVSRAGRVFE